MLRFVTQKFRTQSLNEVDQPFQYKSDDDRDSGTESDDENTEFEDSQENVDNTERTSFSGDSCQRRPSSGAPQPPPPCEESNHGAAVAQQRRRAFGRRSMDTSISSCHSTKSSASALLLANGNSSDADDYGVVPLEKHVPSPILAMLDVDSALPSDSDHCSHHSSEEELEGINSSGSGRRRRKHAGFKLQYKWDSLPSPDPPQTYQPEKRKWSQANRRSFGNSSAGSSDDEVRDLMCSPAAPVEFRTSPPAELLRPTRATVAARALATLTYVVDVSGANVSYASDLVATKPPTMLIHARPPPTKLFHFSSSNFTPFEVCAVSPRKRHRQMAATAFHHHHPYHPVPCHGDAGDGHPVQRPCLDFEKMQQKEDPAPALLYIVLERNAAWMLEKPAQSRLDTLEFLNG